MADLGLQFALIGEEIRHAIDKVLASQHFVLGPQLEALEGEMARYCERRFAIGVASGTDALTIGLRAAGVGAGDEVILPAFTFLATAGAMIAAGARPVFADSEPQTLNVDPGSVRSLITPRTRAIIAVHLYGGAADIEPLVDLASQRGLVLIEDNAQSLGAALGGKKLGSFGAVATTSFYPSKNLGAYGDAGMIFTDSQEIAERTVRLRNHGQTGRYVSAEPGWNSRLDEMQAAVLRVKARHLDRWIAARRAHAARYDATPCRRERTSALEPEEKFISQLLSLYDPNRVRGAQCRRPERPCREASRCARNRHVRFLPAADASSAGLRFPWRQTGPTTRSRARGARSIVAAALSRDDQRADRTGR